MNTMDILDTRDLEQELQDLRETDAGVLDDTDRERMAALEELESDLGGWGYGHEMIAERDFEEYAQHLAEDIGAIPEDAHWPASCINWRRAARELAMDYTSVEFEGSSYYTRAF